MKFLRYEENIGLKTNKGGLHHCKIDPKVVDVYPIPNSNRCPIKIFEEYLSLMPPNRSCNAFYLQPLKNYSATCLFQNSAVGVNKLQQVVKILCKRAGLTGRYTNHSLRATAATRLYHSNFDEQVIQEITGHRSLAVKVYKRTCSTQHQLASNCVSGCLEPPSKRAKY